MSAQPVSAVGFGPNAVLPCGTTSARRRHQAHGEVCPTCDTGSTEPADRMALCPGCDNRERVSGGVFARHMVRVVRGATSVTTARVCDGSGCEARPVGVLGEGLKARRVALGLTQMQVAQRAMVHRSAVATLEAGTSTLRVPDLLAVVAALGCDLTPVPR